MTAFEMQAVRTLSLVFLCLSVSYCGRTRIPSDAEVDMAYALLNVAFPPCRGPVKVLYRIDKFDYNEKDDKYTLSLMAVDSMCQTLPIGKNRADCPRMSNPTEKNFTYLIGNVQITKSGYEVLGGSFRRPTADEFLEIDR